MDRLKFRGCFIGKGFTQNSLADAMHMTVQTFIRKQRNDTFTAKEIARLCEILELSPEEMQEIFFDLDPV